MIKQVRMSMDFGLGRSFEIGTVYSDGPSLAIELKAIPKDFVIPGMKGGNFTNKTIPFWLADALPDSWGEKTMQHEMLKAGMSIRDITVSDRLAYIGHSGLGCWRFTPAINLAPTLEKIADLAWIHDQAIRLREDKDCDLRWMIGSLSLGGARPKVFVDLEKDGSPSFSRLAQDRDWLLKFPGSRDASDAGRWEVAYGNVARAFGINMQPCVLVAGEYFATRRFDVAAGKRFLLRTLAGLNEASHSDAEKNSYESVLDHIGRLCGDYSQAIQVAKLALYNHLMLNWDDHAKNVSFLMDGNGKWRLAPFYDLTYNVALNSHAMSLNGAIMPELSDFVEVFNLYGIDKRQIIKEVTMLADIVQTRWDEIVDAVGIDREIGRQRREAVLESVFEFAPTVAMSG